MRSRIFSYFSSVIVFVFGVVFMPAHAFSQEDTLNIGISVDIPPYVISDQDRGIEVDIIRAVYDLLGVSVKIHYLPRKRLLHSFLDGQFDSICTSKFDHSQLFGDLQIYSSNPTTVFQDTAITLGDGPLITSIAQLYEYSVISFVNAQIYLGQEYRKAVERNRHYMEVSDQSLQISLLFQRRFRVVIADRIIFKYWLQRYLKTAPQEYLDLANSLEYHDIFPSFDRCLFFFSERQRDLFNTGLKAIQASGDQGRIIDSYLN